jgi:peptidoglycan/LPS O-acetylase OafA/YrhL
MQKGFRHIPFLDHIRGLAIILVLLAHSSGAALDHSRAHPTGLTKGLWLNVFVPNGVIAVISFFGAVGVAFFL